LARIAKYTLAGLIGALLAWAALEPIIPNDNSFMRPWQNFVVGLVCGLLIGALLGVAESLSGLSPKDSGKAVLSGAVCGAAGGVVGLSIGNAVYSAAYTISGASAVLGLPPGTPSQARTGAAPGLLAFVLMLIGRGLGWALLGAVIGASQGIATSSTKKMLNAAIGGLIGGGIGGSVFEVMVWLTAGGLIGFPTPVVRFISFSCTGAGIGFFIGLVEEIGRKAWLIRLVGRNEGREFSLYRTITRLGRSELADIPVFGDPDVVERHATITLSAGRYAVEDIGSPMGTALNGNRITGREFLRDRDEITIGKTRFLFRDKAGARSVSSQPPPGAAQPASSRCPFCGGVRDSSGKCDCVVPPDKVAVSEPQSAPTARITAAGSGPRLVSTSGPRAGQVFALKSGVTEIGREQGKDICLAGDSSVSRAHARIAEQVTEFQITDLGSTNGTFVNGNRVTQYALKPGDVVRIGEIEFRYER